MVITTDAVQGKGIADDYYTRIALPDVLAFSI